MAVIELFSPFPPDECAARLRAATDTHDLFPFHRSRPLIGRVSNGSVRLRKRVDLNPTFLTTLVGTLEGNDHGTVFRGRAGMHPYHVFFFGAWFSGLVLLGGAISVLAVAQMLGFLIGNRRIQSTTPLWFAPVVPMLMAVLGVYYLRWARRVVRREEQNLVGYVARIIGSPSSEPMNGSGSRKRLPYPFDDL